jgi:tight adherence protein B
LTGIATAIVAYVLGKRVDVACIAMLVGFVLPYSYASIRRNKRFEKFEELFPEAIDTLARAVRAGHAFTTALEMITAEVSEPVAGEFRQLYEEQKFGMPVRDALLNLTERMPLVDVKFFVTAVMCSAKPEAISRDSGQLSHVIRERFRSRGRCACTPPRPAHHGAADGHAAHYRHFTMLRAESHLHSAVIFRSGSAILLVAGITLQTIDIL